LVYLREIARTIGGATGVFGGSRISCSLPLKIVEQNRANGAERRENEENRSSIGWPKRYIPAASLKRFRCSDP
jgi:hypothetical protein